MITPKTSVYCVMGNPISQSLSPILHNRAFSHTGYDGVYVAFPVSDIRSAIAGVKALGIQGASITIPHKTAVIPLLDEIDPLAHKIGAVNTLVNRNGWLWEGTPIASGLSGPYPRKRISPEKRFVSSAPGEPPGPSVSGLSRKAGG